MSSRRLPGKTMMSISGQPMLYYVIERAASAELIDTLIVATPESPDNAPIWELCDKLRVNHLHGPEEDVLTRVLRSAHNSCTDVIVEITGDCPLIDPNIIDTVAGYMICGEWDFVGNDHPHTWPKGMDVRAFKTSTLAYVNEQVKGDARESYWREHVSPFIYDREGSKYKCLNITAPDNLTYPQLNLSVDSREDFRRAASVIEALRAGNPMFNCKDILEYLVTLPGYEYLQANKLYTEPDWLKGATG